MVVGSNPAALRRAAVAITAQYTEMILCALLNDACRIVCRIFVLCILSAQCTHKTSLTALYV